MEKLNVSSYAPCPHWLSDEGLRTLEAGYLLPGECPRDLYLRVAHTAAKYLNKPELQQDFFDVLYKAYIGLSTPVASNFGTNKGQAISCFSAVISDSVDGIYKSLREAALLSKAGGGHGLYYGDLRPAGSPIGKNNGTSGSVLTWAKQFDLCSSSVSQGNTRRGSFAHYIPIEHPDAYDFLLAKDHLEGDPRNMLDSNIAFTITDAFMQKVLAGDEKAHKIWGKTLEMNLKVGTPYLLFIDNVNNQRSEAYKLHNLFIKTSNLCVVGDTKILTSEGHIPIKELENKTIEVWNGEVFSQTTVYKTGVNQSLLKITTDSGQELICTPYHKFHLHSGSKKNIVIKDAQDLLVNDKLIKFELPLLQQGDKILENAYANGFYTGDGTKVKNKQQIYLYGKKKKLAHLFTCKFTESKCSDRLVGNYTTLFSKFFIPNVTYSLQSRLDWFAGLLDSDGCLLTNKQYNTQGLQITSINLPFIKEVQLFLQMLGVYSKITKNKTEGIYFLPANNGTGLLREFNCKECYRLVIASSGVETLLKLGLNCHRLCIKSSKANREATQFIKIKKVEHLSYTEDTYCFTEPLRNLGMFNGILVGNCAEILEYADPLHTFVCCLCSLNLSLWEDWKDYKSQNTNKTVPELAVYLLDAVMDDFIFRGSKEPGLANAVRSAQKGRALGIGTMGLAYLYQQKNLPFHSFDSRNLNIEIHKYIKQLTEKASRDMYLEYGGCEWSEGTKMRHSLLRATAPTRTNCVISGAHSPGIEPSDSNSYTAKQAKGSFIRKNHMLEALLETKNKNTYEVWDSILYHNGSVFHLDFLDINEKLLFATAREIDPEALLIQAADRTPYIDQGQSLNRFVHPNIPIKKLNDLIFKTWKSGVKSTYYTKSSSEKIIDKVKNKAHIITKPDCIYCTKAKELFTTLGISYSEYSLDTVTHFTWNTVPQIWLEGHFIGGYHDLLEFTNINNNKSYNTSSLNSVPSLSPVTSSFQECSSCEA